MNTDKKSGVEGLWLLLSFPLFIRVHLCPICGHFFFASPRLRGDPVAFFRYRVRSRILANR
jgi:hypothetical protein